MISWIGVDWGTTNLRAFAIDDNGLAMEEKSSPKGMSSLKPEEFEATLVELIDDWLDNERCIPVFACGMVGARQGWVEAQYRAVPCTPVSSSQLTNVKTTDRRIDVKILPGLCQSSPADVMRGEETQIAGSICLPGTHSKWVRVKNGNVVSFRTFMTGEMFALLSEQSVLRHSVSEVGTDVGEFLKAVSIASEDPNSTTETMFSIRAGSLLADVEPTSARANLSGMLVGQELGVAKKFWDGLPVIVVGAQNLSKLYVRALKQLSVKVTVESGNTAVLDGLMRVASEEIATA